MPERDSIFGKIAKATEKDWPSLGPTLGVDRYPKTGIRYTVWPADEVVEIATKLGMKQGPNGDWSFIGTNDLNQGVWTYNQNGLLVSYDVIPLWAVGKELYDSKRIDRVKGQFQYDSLGRLILEREEESYEGSVVGVETCIYVYGDNDRIRTGVKLTEGKDESYSSDQVL